MCARFAGSSGAAGKGSVWHVWHGRPSRFTEAVKERLRGWLREQPDHNQAELAEQLQASSVGASRSRIGQVLQGMGMGRKKRFTPPSATRRPTVSGAKNFWPPSPRSRRRG
jgi:hypothetical protein